MGTAKDTRRTEHFIRKGELPRVALCGAAFFLILCSYYILRPVRDEMGVQYGADKLHWLFTGTLLLTLLAVPFFGWIVRHLPRKAILPVVYAFFICNLLGFYWAFSVGTITLTGAGIFFVWLSVFNLFAISLFWSVVSDTFTKEESHRLYGYIAAGGTAGALAGPAITAMMARHVQTATLIGLAAVLLVAAAVCMAVMRARSQQQSNLVRQGNTQEDSIKPIGGSLFAGIPLTLKLPSLRGIALLIICYTAVSTTLYIELVDLVGQTYSSSGDRKAFFAKIDLTVNCIALLFQMLGTRFIVQRFGLRLGLSAVPLMMLACLATLSVWATAIAFAAVQVLHRAAEYAVTRPGREMVYTTVNAESRYKAKSFIDTAVYRANDAASAWLIAAVRSMGLNSIFFIGIPAAIAWFFTALKVGGRHDRLDSRRYPKEAANDPA
jgi:AAA family ATP:ADP antiporter